MNEFFMSAVRAGPEPEPESEPEPETEPSSADNEHFEPSGRQSGS